MTRTVHIVCGPTAGGKSARAIEMAKSMDGVIINCDSLQIYNALPILTAQPSYEERAQISHELYATLKPEENCSAGKWRKTAEPIINKILDQKKIPIIVGGTGLYIKALIEGLSPIPDVPEKIRKATIEKQKELGNPGFHEALKKRDPVMAKKLNAADTTRLVRAWEILEATGKSLAEWQELPLSGPPENLAFEIHKIIPQRDILYERCNMRFLQMMENDVASEVEEFNKQYPSENISPKKALGYFPLLNYIQGKISKQAAIEQAQGETRRYAKRQVTWFKHQIKTPKL